MVVLRCIGPSKFFFERVLFPLEVLTFMAPFNSRVEIWGNELYGPRLEERIRVPNNEDSFAAWFKLIILIFPYLINLVFFSTILEVLKTYIFISF